MSGENFPPYNTRWSPKPKGPMPERKTTFVGGSVDSPVHPTGAIVPLVNESGFAFAPYSVYVWALDRHLHDPWTWGHPMQGDTEAQPCAVKDGVLYGINNELARAGISARVKRL